ncbi:hypothetical protein CSW98_01425 [Vibrio sp. HA2012]|uniref:TIGR02642 family protein n=1 Tax=Vibrio sp. HA2012 TaxID=1971595 RepID=UPI000C2C5A5E|nr:TIGR02642 family protein [Vibrio sp. HA2012]PJC87814.1 hypothetical protein CSW98_01425 [Vibrio sp. HA2012]
MSDKAIELFIRMHLEKTPTLQRGRQVLTGDVIMAAMGAVQHQQPLGCDLISARWLDDLQAMRRVETWIMGWSKSSSRPELMFQVGLVALAVFCGKPTADQERKLISLWKRHSAQGHRSDRLVKRYQTKIDFLNRQFADTEFRQKQNMKEVNELERLIEKEKSRLHVWATEKTRESFQCPKCSGSGLSASGQCCNECGGFGHFAPKAENVRQHLRKTGIARVSDKLWNREIKPQFEALLSRFHQEHDETARVLGKRLHEERAA